MSSTFTSGHSVADVKGCSVLTLSAHKIERSTVAEAQTRHSFRTSGTARTHRAHPTVKGLHQLPPTDYKEKMQQS